MLLDQHVSAQSKVAPADRGVLTCEDLHKVYRMGEVDVRARDGVDFSLHAGELLVLAPTGGRKPGLERGPESAP